MTTEHDTVQDNPVQSNDSAIDPAAAAGCDETSAPVVSDEGGATAEIRPPTSFALVAEARKYRKRAQAAEQELAALKNDLAARATQFAEQAKTIESLERRAKIDELLRHEQTFDVEAARLLTEAAVAQMPEADIELAVRELKRAKPYLFRSTPHHSAPRSTSGAMSAKASDETTRERQTGNAAAQAVQSGARADLLRYLRLRRTR